MPDYWKPFIMYVDASKLRVGTVLNTARKQLQVGASYWLLFSEIHKRKYCVSEKATDL